MKYSILLFLCLICDLADGQINMNNLGGNWVATKITYKNGAELPETNVLKYTYLKYIFSKQGYLYYSITFDSRGAPLNFEINDDILYIKTSGGSVVNIIKIEKLTPDSLIVLNGGVQGFDSPNEMRYDFVPEIEYQKSRVLTENDIHSVYNGDTTYNECPKIYATFDGRDLQQFLYDHINAGKTTDNSSGHLVASFIVSKFGVADSLKILESISPAYDELFAKAFAKATHKWAPAVLNGKFVNVQMYVETRYSTFDAAFPADQYTDQANIAFNEKKYDRALYFYDQALKTVPFDKSNLYNRGICKKMLGNLKGACEDWQTIRKLGSKEVDALLEKYCH